VAGQKMLSGRTKMHKTRNGRKKAIADSYLELIRRFPLRPIRMDSELDQAIRVIDSLLDKARLDSGERDYLDVLSDLVENYEEKHHPIRPSTDAEMLAFLLEIRQLKQNELSRQTGIATSTISEVLAGTRELTRGQIVKLSTFFHVEPGVFMSSGN
jgi:HTH-type transcriptional regulator / antitoxin HigA